MPNTHLCSAVRPKCLYKLTSELEMNMAKTGGKDQLYRTDETGSRESCTKVIAERYWRDRRQFPKSTIWNSAQPATLIHPRRRKWIVNGIKLLHLMLQSIVIKWYFFPSWKAFCYCLIISHLPAWLNFSLLVMRFHYCTNRGEVV